MPLTSKPVQTGRQPDFKPLQPASARRRWLGAALGLAALPLPALAADEAAAPSAWRTATLPQAVECDLTSALTGQRYRIFVSVPHTPAPVAGHPVFYALDGNASFPSLALMSRTAARRRAMTGQAPALVVGIGYASGTDYDGPARALDYTPPAPGHAAGEGGAGRFLDFIETELQPLIAARYPVDGRRQALFGHSYGGLCTLHALFTRPAAFQCFIAASPSIWWGGRHVLAGLAGLARRAQAPLPRVLITVGELEQKAMPDSAPTPGGDQRAPRRMVDEARELATALQAMPAAVARARFVELAGEDHGSALFPALSRGLAFFLAPE